MINAWWLIASFVAGLAVGVILTILCIASGGQRSDDEDEWN